MSAPVHVLFPDFLFAGMTCTGEDPNGRRREQDLAVMTSDALDELGLKIGDRAVALIKATEVMVIKET